MAYIEKFLEEGRDYFTERADRDIERNRKGNFTIRVTLDGAPVENAEITYRLKDLDFDLGCNLFMLGQYDDPEKEERYLSQWKNLFNTAVVPLYWEGTEPEPGLLRYSSKTENNVYRRPPVDMVVEYCQQNGIRMKGHPLFWHEFIPQWLPENWDELYPLIEKRFQEISERYADKIPVFDVVNEPARLWDLSYEIKTRQRKCVFPPEGYLEQIFGLAEKYFPDNIHILNEAVAASLAEFKGIYSGYYLLVEKLLKEGVKVDRIGLQCHAADTAYFRNVYQAERLYGILDCYAGLGRPLVLSEIGLGCEDEELQAQAVEQLYKICFSHESMSGIFWWNLDDNGVLTDKKRNAVGENLPHSGIVRNGVPKAAYKVLDRLINQEWTTQGSQNAVNGTCAFRGFYGTYEVTVACAGVKKTVNVSFEKDGEAIIDIMEEHKDGN